MRKILLTDRACPICGKTFHPGQKTQVFCSNICRAQSTKNETVKEWLAGKDVGSGVNYKLPLSVREFLFERSNYKCEECGFEGYNEKTGKTILQIHHVDGDSKNTRPENLKVLCPNCHALTDNYMGLNKGKSSRKKRYK